MKTFTERQLRRYERNGTIEQKLEELRIQNHFDDAVKLEELSVTSKDCIIELIKLRTQKVQGVKEQNVKEYIASQRVLKRLEESKSSESEQKSC